MNQLVSKNFRLASMVLLVIVISLSCQNKRSPGEKPNVVYVLTDQWRAQATGYNGDPNLEGKTPNLDKLAAQGINFTNAVSVDPICTPYRAALLTGQYPTTTGMFFNDLHLPDEALTMAEIFKGSDYQTAYIGKWHLDGMGRFAFTPPERRQGFDYWKALECSHDYNNMLYYTGDSAQKHYWEGYSAYAKTEDAIQYMKRHADDQDPFLLFLSLAAPHFPHPTAPEELKKEFPASEIKLRPNVPEKMAERARKESVGYYAHILALDKCLGDLTNAMKETGISENTIFVFTSDHGEMMGSQGVRPRLKQVPYAESVKVPFLMKYPALFGNDEIEVAAPITTPDILPTLLSLANIPVPESIEGENMAVAINHPEKKKDKAALVMNVSPSDVPENPEYRGIYTDRYAYIENLEGPWLMYDNIKDPYQMNNLVGNPEYADIQDKLNAMLQRELEEIGDDFKPREYYIDKWDYELKWGHIPYSKDAEPQGPAL